MDYNEFLKNKIALSKKTGFEIEQSEINPMLKPHQKDIVQWAISGGCRAIFASFGLGKSFCQLEILRIIGKHYTGRQLVIAPLGVRQEFRIDAEKLGIEITFLRRSAEIGGDGLYITNYESVRDGRLDVNLFNAVSLDEASILRSYGSKTYKSFLGLFADVKYKFVATATPSPNRYKELIHYAGFLGIMQTGDALTRFFKRDSTQSNNLQIHPHMKEKFWLWMSSWALFLQKPSDLGYSDEGYDLPPMKVIYHKVLSDSTPKADRYGQIMMFNDSSMSLQDAAKEKRESIDVRIEKMMEILADNPDDHFVIWHDQEAERHAIRRALPISKAIYGSETNLERREEIIIGFSNGEFQYLATKPSLSGSGCNLQRHCHKAIFLGIGFKFNDFLQSCMRIYRFLQTHECEIHIIYAESEATILETLKKKWRQHDKMVEKMTGIIKEHGLSNTSLLKALEKSLGMAERIEVKGNNFLVANNDCVEECRTMESDSVDLIHSSIPFCYDEHTTVLSRRGWIGFNEIILGQDEIATVSKNGQLEYQKPTHVVWEKYEGQMIHFSGRSFDLKVTPNHRMYVARRGNKFSPDSFIIETADNITTEYETAIRKENATNERILNGWRMCLIPPKRGTGNRPERINIPSLPDDVLSGHGVELYWIETADFMRLAGWYISEGHADSFTSGRSGGRLSIGQSPFVNADLYEEIKSLMTRIGLSPSLGKNQISIWCRNLAYFMQVEFGHGAINKQIPRWVLELHPDFLEILRDTMMKGDGAKTGTSYASISSELRDNFQEICIKTGWRAATNGTNIVGTGTAQLFPEIRNTPQRVDYSGMIGCATVPNGTMIVRRSGQVCVSGNSNHYEYSPSYNDFGCTENNDHFWQQMDYLTPELLRILKPGRIYACHTKDRILFGNVTGKGVPTVSPFHMETCYHYMKHGFDYLGMITVVTDVVRENNQTYRLGWTEQCKDATKMGVGSPEYILLLRKPQTDRTRAYADEPVVKDKDDYTRAQWQVDAHAFWRCSGDRLLSPDEMAALPGDVRYQLFKKHSLENIYNYEHHVKFGSDMDAKGMLPSTFMSIAPESISDDVWTDINRMLTLNGDQAKRNLNLHICPLQFDIVNRIINRYSNPGDLVFDPFGGLMTVPLCALKLGRKGRGVELNPGSFFDGVKYLEAEEREQNMPSFFDTFDQSQREKKTA